MGKPAARMGDMTAHGGAIVIGAPTVLIGGMPAARIGDMHVCPMVTGVVPHVGGPVTLGSPMVLISGMPAARMGDMLICTGPPDTILMGCPTVLIGEGGGGSSSGGGAGSSAAAAAQASASAAQFDNNESTVEAKHWVVFEFVDAAGNPVSGVPYKFTDPDGKEAQGSLRLDGKIRRSGLSEGQCEVELYSLGNAKWGKEKADVGEAIKISADAEGFEDGTLATIDVYCRDLNRTDIKVESITSEVRGGKVKAEWVFAHDDDLPDTITAGEADIRYSSKQYFFEVIVYSLTARSSFVTYQDKIKIELLDSFGDAVINEPYILYLSDGQVRKGTLDGSGKAEEKDIPPGFCRVVFPERQEVNW